jgi:hypothetical protein
MILTFIAGAAFVLMLEVFAVFAWMIYREARPWRK